MKDEYDFSAAERGKFYDAEAKLSLPVYLEQDVLSFVREIADRRDKDISQVVNELIRSNMKLSEILQ